MPEAVGTIQTKTKYSLSYIIVELFAVITYFIPILSLVFAITGTCLAFANTKTKLEKVTAIIVDVMVLVMLVIWLVSVVEMMQSGEATSSH